VHVADLAPIVLFVYNRPVHTRRVVEALQANLLARDSDLFVYSDYPKVTQHASGVKDVRRLLEHIKGFKSVNIIERERNYGCANSIVSGITEIVNRLGKIIVIEDDVLTSPYFLQYINDGLSKYENDGDVACIHGYLYPLTVQLPETFFIKGADTWGWGTWKRAWDLFEFDAGKLLIELQKRNLTKKFDLDGSCAFTKMLKDQINGKIDAWDIQWTASAFLHDKFTLYPGRSLVQNIGFDSSGTHCPTDNLFDVKMSDKPISLKRIEIAENNYAREAIAEFWRSTTIGFWKKIRRIIRLAKGKVLGT
jgi:hypothetical protein